jgi:hypothetical protein
MTMHSRPIAIDPPSATTCAPNMTRQRGPMLTLPQITAFGATQALGWMRGVASSCLINIWCTSIVFFGFAVVLKMKPLCGPLRWQLSASGMA